MFDAVKSAVEAEALLLETLAMKETRLGPEGVRVGNTLHELAKRSRRLGREGKVESLFERTRGIMEARLGTEDARVQPNWMGREGCVRHVEDW